MIPTAYTQHPSSHPTLNAQVVNQAVFAFVLSFATGFLLQQGSIVGLSLLMKISLLSTLVCLFTSAASFSSPNSIGATRLAACTGLLSATLAVSSILAIALQKALGRWLAIVYAPCVWPFISLVRELSGQFRRRDFVSLGMEMDLEAQHESTLSESRASIPQAASPQPASWGRSGPAFVFVRRFMSYYSEEYCSSNPIFHANAARGMRA